MNNILKNFRKAKILVIGDIMLDKYVYGEVNRISPEAPVPVLKVDKEDYKLGGAANVAANIASLCGQAALYGVVGNDFSGTYIDGILRNAKIKFCPVHYGKTIEKIRYVTNNHHLIRVDKEDTEPKPSRFEAWKQQIFRDFNPDIIVISDYAKGTLTEELMRQLGELMRLKATNKPILIDPKPPNFHLYKKCFLITPNEQEALEMTNTADVYKAGKSLKRKLKSNVIITRGKKGMLVFPKKGKTIEIPTAVKEAYDVTGAGDTVIATLALALASDASLEEAAILANHAAGIVVEKTGTSTVKFSELESKLLKEQGKIKTRQELKDITDKLKSQGKTVVWTNGCFDLLHEGHVHYLKAAKELGDILIVGLNSDKSVKKLKGKNRPVRPEQARAEVLAALELVDYITLFPETTVASLLDLLKPSIYTKAADYDLEKMNQEERKVIEGYGGKFEFIKIEKDISTSGIIDKIRQQT